MAYRLTTYVRQTLESVLQPTSPHAGSTVHSIPYEVQLGHGTGSHQADKTYRATLTVDTTGTEIDLQTAEDAYGVALGLDEVVAFSFAADEDNTANVNVTGGASNKWEAFLLATGDGLSIKPGMRLQSVAPLDGSLAVTASTKTIKFAAASGTATVDVLFVGRSQ